MRANEAFPSKFLKSADVKEKPCVAVIKHLTQETVGQGQDAKEKHVLYFEDQKPVVLNRTNWDALEEAFGDSENWPGYKVKIRCARTQYQGKPTDGIRLDAIGPERRDHDLIMKSLSPDLRDRLTKLLPRLASPFEGERVATVAAIERVLQAEGCDFHDLTQAVQQPPRITATAAPAERGDGGLEHNKLRSIIDRIEGADAQRCFLNARSRTFLIEYAGDANATTSYFSPSDNRLGSKAWSSRARFEKAFSNAGTNPIEAQAQSCGLFADTARR